MKIAKNIDGYNANPCKVFSQARKFLYDCSFHAVTATVTLPLLPAFRLAKLARVIATSLYPQPNESTVCNKKAIALGAVLGDKGGNASK